MTFIKTTQSGFEGYLKDSYTMLPECTERCLGSELSAKWNYSKVPEDFAASRASVKRSIEAALFGPARGGHYSPSLQATIYDGACLALEREPTIANVAISTPNLHYLPAHFLARLPGDDFADDVFVPTNEPSGTIFCDVARTSSS
mmetsp:Transcript_1842/g.5506  ORF Transcript_1842/g.5506 Transcript_1842/m.5506 type:complete len:145 (+) Transcript_1842:2-436(+)